MGNGEGGPWLMGEGEEWKGFERTIVMWIDTKGSPSLEFTFIVDDDKQ
jgi:hypothetical protein